VSLNTKWIAVSCFAVVAIIVLVHVLTQRRISPLEPTVTSPAPPDLPAEISSVVVPLEVSLQLLEETINDVVEAPLVMPPKAQDDHLDLTIGAEIDRSRIALSGEDGTLRGGTDVSGLATLRGHVHSSSVSQDVSLAGSVFVSFVPELSGDWRVIPRELELRFDLREATANVPVTRILTRPVKAAVEVVEDIVPFVGRALKEVHEEIEKEIEEEIFIPISIRSVVRDWLEPELDEYRSELVDKGVQLEDVRRRAETAWNEWCRVHPLGEGLWLETVPVRFRASQPAVDADSIELQLGLEVETRVVSKDRGLLDCPFEPVIAVEEDEEPAAIRMSLPADINFKTVEDELLSHIGSEWLGQELQMRVRNVRLLADRSRLLLRVEVDIRAGRGFSKSVSGRVYIWSSPRLTGDRQWITLEDVEVDVESHNALVEFFGEIAEPVLLRKIRAYRLDLGAAYEKVRTEADAVVEAASSGEYQVAGGMTEVWLDALHVGPEHLHLVVRAEGRVSIQAATTAAVLVE